MTRKTIYKWMWYHLNKHGEFTPTANNIMKYLDLNIELLENEFSCASICSDPMNGCPGDFAEDFGRKSSIIRNKIASVEFSLSKAIIDILGRVIYQEYSRLEYNYQQLPWIKNN